MEYVIELDIKMNKSDFIKKIKDNFLYVITVIETILSIFAIVKGLLYFAIVLGIILFFTIILTIVDVVKRKRKRNKPIAIGELPIESLFLAEINRSQMDSVCIREAIHTVRIVEKDLSVTFNYSGTCTEKKGESNFIFSIGGDSPCAFKDLNCFGYDLVEDPNKKLPIIPILASRDGLCKKVKLPLKRHLNQYDPFSVELNYTWPSCMKYEDDYYASTLSFKNETIEKYTVMLIFSEIKPDWVRVYTENGELIKDLSGEVTKLKNGDVEYVYIDDVTNPSANSKLIYQFYRDKPLN